MTTKEKDKLKESGSEGGKKAASEFVAPKSRNDTFSQRTPSEVWLEIPDDENPYIAAEEYCYGYDILELGKNLSYSDMLYLILRGELPGSEQSELFRKLAILFINPGPRSNSVRAAVQAAVGKTHPMYILPISLSIHTGKKDGIAKISSVMRFIAKSSGQSAEECAESIAIEAPEECGFGRSYDGIHIMASKFLQELNEVDESNSSLAMMSDLNILMNDRGVGVLPHGVIAAGLVDLGFTPLQGSALAQLFAAPGLLAHGFEFIDKPPFSVPFVSDDDYEIVEEL